MTVAVNPGRFPPSLCLEEVMSFPQKLLSHLVTLPSPVSRNTQSKVTCHGDGVYVLLQECEILPSFLSFLILFLSLDLNFLSVVFLLPEELLLTFPARQVYW